MSRRHVGEFLQGSPMPLFDGVFVENLSGSSVHLVMVITLRGRDVSAIAAAPITGLPLRHLADIERCIAKRRTSPAESRTILTSDAIKWRGASTTAKSGLDLSRSTIFPAKWRNITLSLNLRVFRETCSFVREAIYIGRCKVALRRKTSRSHGRLGTAVALNDFGAGF